MGVSKESISKFYFTDRIVHYRGGHISGHNSPAANAKELFKPSQFHGSIFGNLAIIRVFRWFGRFSSVSGVQIMA